EHYERAFLALGGSSRCARRSAATPPARVPARPLDDHGPPHDAEELPASRDRFLLDTIGELRAAYELATVAVVGRSFGGLRGSDPIEPIALGKPTIIGPAYANFEYIVGRFLEAGAIKVCPAESLPEVLASLLDDAHERARMTDAGRACIAAERGASARHADLLARLLGRPSTRAEREQAGARVGVETAASLP
ncbi:MAG: 3-deoxy-D-manno-octulosonic acid transferase, partial [Phycisphaerales bacterium]